MYPVSTLFLEAVQQSKRVTTLVEVLPADGSAPVALPVIDGSVRVDDSQAVRRTCEVTVADPTAWIPRSSTDLLHTDAGSELRLWRGVRRPDGVDELVPLGVFPITKTTVGDGASGLALAVEGSDRSVRVQRARWAQPYAVPAGSNIATAAAAILANRVPGLPTPAFAPTAATTPAATFGLEVENDPWEDARSLFSAIGHELFFDVNGRPISRPVPDPATDPEVLALVEGRAPMIEIQRAFDPSKRYTAVVVRGEGTGVPAPVYAVVQLPDVDFVPYFLTSSFILTPQQAQDAGAAQLLRVARSEEAVQVTMVPNPALDAGDIVRVERAASGVTGAFAVTALEIPLSAANAMSVTMRPRR